MSKHCPTSIRVPVEEDNPALRRIESLCIQCGQCREMCQNTIGVLGCYQLENTKDTAICIHCGQCIHVCPTHALTERKEWLDVRNAIRDPKKTVVFMTSPSVRVALAEEFGSPAGEYHEAEMVGALRALGADYVFDTTFAADLTIMEEASELIERVTQNKPLPQFTSCCPAWVKFVETYYPELIANLSSSKSPISMFGPTIKSYFAAKQGIDSNSLVTVALTPCTAKKYEIRRSEMNDSGKHDGQPERRDTDYVITTRELAEWLKCENLDLQHVEQSDYDSLMPRGSGAGIIFGNTGGVMEAAVRTAYHMLTGQEPPKDLYELKPVRGLEGIKTAELKIQDLTLRIAVVHTTENARKFIEQMKEEAPYHFVEVMTCPGGCIGGGGQPIHQGKDLQEIRKARIQGLYDKDEELNLRCSHNNPELKRLYEEFYDTPLSALAEEMLHTSYFDKSKDLGEDPSRYHASLAKKPTVTKKVWRCLLCGYIYEGDLTLEPEDYQCPVCFTGKDNFEQVEVESVVEPTLQEETKPAGLRYRCLLCGYIYEGDLTLEPEDYQCPVCFTGKENFERIEAEASAAKEEAKPTTSDIRYRCILCGYIYEGDLTLESDDYQCPVCFTGKENFEKIS